MATADPEFFHSADIIEFFWFLATFIMMICSIIRVFKYKEEIGKDADIANDQGKKQQPFQAAESGSHQNPNHNESHNEDHFGPEIVENEGQDTHGKNSDLGIYN